MKLRLILSGVMIAVLGIFLKCYALIQGSFVVGGEVVEFEGVGASK